MSKGAPHHKRLLGGVSEHKGYLKAPPAAIAMAGYFSKDARAARAEVKREKAQGAVQKHAGEQPPPLWNWRKPWATPSFLFYLWCGPVPAAAVCFMRHRLLIVQHALLSVLGTLPSSRRAYI